MSTSKAKNTKIESKVKFISLTNATMRELNARFISPSTVITETRKIWLRKDATTILEHSMI